MRVVGHLVSPRGLRGRHLLRRQYVHLLGERDRSARDACTSSRPECNHVSMFVCSPLPPHQPALARVHFRARSGSATRALAPTRVSVRAPCSTGLVGVSSNSGQVQRRELRQPVCPIRDPPVPACRPRHPSPPLERCASDMDLHPLVRDGDITRGHSAHRTIAQPRPGVTQQVQWGLAPGAFDSIAPAQAATYNASQVP